MLIIKRLLGNLLDFLIYIIIFFILFKMSGLETDSNHLYYFYFISFVITFIFPVITIKNTIGKKLLKLEWENNAAIKLKLSTKYFIYYLAVAPSFSIFSAISSFPLLNPLFNNFDKIIVIQFAIAYVITDIIVFLFGLGKYHILDYLFNINLNNHPFSKKPFKFLGVIYLFFGLFFVLNLYVYKYSFTFSNFENSISSTLEKEHYPSDQYYGSYVFTVNEKSDGVFKPTKPFTFLFNQKLQQKTLYVNLPKEVFNSENERKSICLNLLVQSITNDLFSDLKPEQTRIVLSNIERGIFLEYYNYFYIYYFDNDLVKWNVYGGIEADSITMKNYLNFNYNYNKSILNKQENIEKKYNLTWKELIEKSEIDSLLNNEIKNVFNANLSSELYYDRLKITNDTNYIEFKKIEFKDTKLNGYMNFNFPISDLQQRVNLTNLVNGKAFEYDENVDYLKLLREETTNKGM